MRILFLTDNFPPEVNAPANRTFEHCREWVKAGEEVTVITGAPNFPSGKVHPGYRNGLWQRERIEGIEVIRVWTYITANAGFFKRTTDYISFAVSASIAGLFRRADVIVATSPQFFTAVAGCFLGTVKRRPWIFELRDIWPESIKAVGAIREGRILGALEKLEMFLYRNADRIVPVSEAFKRKLEARGIDSTKMTVVMNGVNSSLFQPQEPDETLRESLGIKGRFVISYIGTLGMAHGLDSMIRATKALPEDWKVSLLVIGDGAERANLERLRTEIGADNVSIIPPIPHDQIPRYLAVSDATLVHLKRSDTFKDVLPSKIFEAAAMRRPILLGVDGEARRLVEKYKAGLFFEPESSEGFAQALRSVRESTETYRDLQEGCDRLTADFDRSALAGRLLEVLKATALSKH